MEAVRTLPTNGNVFNNFKVFINCGVELLNKDNAPSFSMYS